MHISTDYVFGKEPYNTPCKEDQKGTPTGVYGATKLLGEQKIIASCCKHIIIRTAWLYSEFGKNFCKTLLNLTATKQQLKVVFDQCGTPTYALDLAIAIQKILEIVTQGSEHDAQHYCGVYHFSNEGVCSWFDFAKMIQQIAFEIGYYDKFPSNKAEMRMCEVLPCHKQRIPISSNSPKLLCP